MRLTDRLVLALLAVASPAFAGLDNLTIDSTLRGDYVLAVMVDDKREYVLKGETPDNVVGGAVGGWRRARYHVTTDSELPIADDLATGLRKALLKNKWLGIATLPTTPADSTDILASRIRKANLRRCMLVTIGDLWTESYRNTSVNYHVKVTVLDDKATTLASTEAQGTYDTSSWAGDGAAEILGQVMTAALAKPEIVAALKD